MIFEHLVYNYGEIYDNIREGGREQILILLDDNVSDENYRIAAQAISLDIRGDFGFFLNGKSLPREYERGDIVSIPKNWYTYDEEYEWTGNLFRINVNPMSGTVQIEDITDAEEHVYRIDYKEWEEALLDWKQFYLRELGFLDFKSIALCHMMGVLILTFDQMSEEHFENEMVTEAINKCAERYGVNKSVIYRDCRKVSGVYSIDDFCKWVGMIFGSRNEDESDYLNEFVLQHLSEYEAISDIEDSLWKHFGIRFL